MSICRSAGLVLAILLAMSVGVALVSAPGCVKQPQHTDIVALAASANTTFYATGTLATLGSFEWDVAPLTTHAAHALKDTAAALRRGDITVDQAKAKAAALDHAHDLLSRALVTCAQDDHTGKCTGDEAAARK